MEFVMDDVHHHYHYRHCRYYRPDYSQGVLADLLADHVLVHIHLYLNRYLHCHQTMGAKVVSEVYGPNYYYYSVDCPVHSEGALSEFLRIHFYLWEEVYYSCCTSSNQVRSSDLISLPLFSKLRNELANIET